MLVLFLSLLLTYVPFVTSGVIIQNRCSFPVYVDRVQIEDVSLGVLEPGDVYQEQYRYEYRLNSVTKSNEAVGTSFKIRRNPADNYITQFEYTYDPNSLSSPTNVWYDISDINDGFPRQFCQWGISLLSSSCQSFICLPNCNDVCSSAYNFWSEDKNNSGCSSSYDLTLIICSG